MRLEKEEEVEDAEAEDENEEANGYVLDREVEEEGEEGEDNDEKAGSPASNVVADDNRVANCALVKLRNRSNTN